MVDKIKKIRRQVHDKSLHFYRSKDPRIERIVLEGLNVCLLGESNIPRQGIGRIRADSKLCKRGAVLS